MRIVEVNEDTVEALVACFRPAGEDGATRAALLPTSAFGGKADVNHCVGECPLLAISGPSTIRSGTIRIFSFDPLRSFDTPTYGLICDVIGVGFTLR